MDVFDGRSDCELLAAESSAEDLVSSLLKTIFGNFEDQHFCGNKVYSGVTSVLTSSSSSFQLPNGFTQRTTPTVTFAPSRIANFKTTFLSFLTGSNLMPRRGCNAFKVDT